MADDLKNRTLTNLYTINPVWLTEAHRKLNAAVLGAYRLAIHVDRCRNFGAASRAKPRTGALTNLGDFARCLQPLPEVD
jgi:hypothetical protein